MPIGRYILSMFELGRKPSQVILVVFLDQKYQKSQRISYPLTNGFRLFLSMGIDGYIA